MKKIVVLTGAGMSVESGLKTFRGEGGLWEGHKVTDVATPEAWHRDMEMVLKFYNERRQQLLSVEPNEAHYKITALQEKFNVVVVTQNVDNLHERAGNKSIIHLHGELTKVRSTKHPHLIYDWQGDLNVGDLCEKGAQLRPHIVWFGEAVPMLESGIREMIDADIAIIIGTSMQVYPAASLIGFAHSKCEVYYIDPQPHISYELAARSNINVINESATTGMSRLVDQLLKGL
jgi:NAD-dependent deacetylase